MEHKLNKSAGQSIKDRLIAIETKIFTWEICLSGSHISLGLACLLGFGNLHVLELVSKFIALLRFQGSSVMLLLVAIDDNLELAVTHDFDSHIFEIWDNVRSTAVIDLLDGYRIEDCKVSPA